MAKRKKIVADMPSLAYPKTDLKKTTYVDESGVLHTYVHDKNQAVIKSITVFATVNDTEMGSVSVTGAVNGEAVVISYSDTKAVSLAANKKEGYSFVKWQSSSDGESYTDISGATSTTYTTTLAQAGEYYFKAVFEQESVGVDYLYLEAAQANSTVSMVSTLETAPDLEYSTDGVTWQEWQHTTAEGTHTFDTITLGAVGDRVYFRGDNPDGLTNMETEAFSNFVMTGAINGGGNVMSLLDKTMALTEVPASGFGPLFAITGEDLEPALLTPPSMETVTTIGDIGCASMYFNCTSLTSAADMPALTTIGDNGCYAIYSGCTFNMSDDGTTLNFAFPTPPVTAGEDTFATAYEVADWMGNTNGFGGDNQ